MFKFIITKIAPSENSIAPFELKLDSPKKNQITPKVAGNYSVTGSVIVSFSCENIILLVRKKDESITEYPLSVSIDEVDKNTTFKFDIKLPIKGIEAEFGVRINDEIFWTDRIVLEPQRKLLRGKADWLFLDNDSNRSLDQFNGKLLISDPVISQWTEYLNNAELKSKAASITDWAFLLAPAKEELFQEFYPSNRGKITPYDQIVQLSASHPFINPINELRADRYLAFSPIDTHWTDYGAYIAAQAVLKQFKLDNLISYLSVNFSVKQSSGDLGSKEVPKVTSGILVKTTVKTVEKIFDNGVPNHGRIWIYKNEAAPCQKTLVIFGDSFSINLAPQLSEIFKRVIYAHSTAVWDEWIVETESPDYVLLQTNQRFVTQAPFGSDIWAKFRKKIQLMGDYDAIALKQRAEKQLLNASNITPYLINMIDIIKEEKPCEQQSSVQVTSSFDIKNMVGKAKSIAIIGNSPILTDGEYGKAIDNHDCIIRINDGRLVGYEKSAGSRTDIRFIGVPLKERYHSFFKDFNEKSFIVSRSSNKDILTQLGWSGNGYFDENFTSFMRDALKKINSIIPLSNIPDKNPRSGIVILSLLLDAMKEGKLISLYGFDTTEVETDAEHFYDDGRVLTTNTANWTEYHCPVNYEFYVLKALEKHNYIRINR